MQIDNASFIYLTFEDFLDNHINDFEEFKKFYKHSNIDDFFDDIKLNYSEFIDVENDFKTKYSFEVSKVQDFETYETKKETIDINDIKKSLLNYSPEALKNSVTDILGSYPDEENDIDFHLYTSTYLVLGKYFNYFDLTGLCFNFKSYDDLRFTAKRIYEYISENNVKIKTSENNDTLLKKDNKTYKWQILIPYLVNGTLEKIHSDKTTATLISKELIAKHDLEINIKDIRPYIQHTYFSDKKKNENLTKNLKSEKKLKEIIKYCKIKNIEITDNEILNKISDFGIEN